MSASGEAWREPQRILFVCLGNICRSPSAEAIARALAVRQGLDHALAFDSAGTGSWHIGDPPDPRAREAAAARGIELTGRARQVSAADFERFDLLIAMDRAVLRTLQGAAPDAEARAKVRLLPGEHEVPDPYYGGPEGFERVLDLLEARCSELLAELTER
ncbi:MAG TPA: low molecular weight protein-tyrosine-phosphatase [Solirubrobacteraceae bacterium]|nr:low molecular weight protein-tyrosine-phosphatase [Solirubrobacteraceae bacterium]